jgi:hypothetical protein
MGVFSDYLNSLDGKADLNIDDVVKDLTRLHETEIGGVNELLSSANAKIETQSTELAESITKLSEAQAETSRVKTANYDLIMSQGINNGNEPNPDEDRVIDGSTITPDDLFASTD